MEEENYEEIEIMLLDETNVKLKLKQVAQLSQKDRTAGWVSFGQKWK